MAHPSGWWCSWFALSARQGVVRGVYDYPRQGADRELKKAVEGYWKGRITAGTLRRTAAGLRRANWRRLAEAGLGEVPTGDFSYDDHVLDTSVMVGAIPARHRAAVERDALDGYFAMARGTQEVAPLEMTKWFDTNYHYLVPELGPDTVFAADSARRVAELTEALMLGHNARPVLVANLDDLATVGGLPGKRLVGGVVDGRNIWINDYENPLATLATLLGLAGQVDVSASCSLLHVPLDTAPEGDIDPQILRWLSLARQKTAEIVTLARGLTRGTDTIAAEIAANRAALAARANSPITRDPAVGARTAAVTAADAHRSRPYEERAAAQRARLGLPPLPTTTIGSFPQTPDLRAARADLRTGRTGTAGYEQRIETAIAEMIAFQEHAGLDVLVHGEPERSDTVQYFAERLTGYLATRHGWVQSYGTRYVRPPILAGDTARQVALALRDEVISLEAARSRMQAAGELATAGYPRAAGPGVYDIHSPRVPTTDEIADLLRKGLTAIPADRLWVNPDCGLKTRDWPETRASPENLVTAARTVRAEPPA
ncbi:hypothetical protein ACFO3J_00730 [Streptomyces polygonati]|uniref:5-methyltetrahydropteroyltriglutamate--homocysteine S-methyltransferase n=1 Tax=Streptomyces polygonati TaxID=1617087 RepID=A0ABV8HD48_9ACTN